MSWQPTGRGKEILLSLLKGGYVPKDPGMDGGGYWRGAGAYDGRALHPLVQRGLVEERHTRYTGRQVRLTQVGVRLATKLRDGGWQPLVDHG